MRASRRRTSGLLAALLLAPGACVEDGAREPGTEWAVRPRPESAVVDGTRGLGAMTGQQAPTLVGAAAADAHTVVVTFSQPIAPASVVADASQFTFDHGLTASLATVAGRTVTLTTSAQDVGTLYQLTVDGLITEVGGLPLAGERVTVFPGVAPPAVVRLNELGTLLGCWQIELRAVTGGSLLGLHVTERTGLSWDRDIDYVFPAAVVPADAILVVHDASGVCNRDNATVELTGPAEQAVRTAVPGQPDITFRGNYDEAWDYWGGAVLTGFDDVLSVRSASGALLDVILLTGDLTGPTNDRTERAAEEAALAGQWHAVGGGVPPGGFVDDAFRAHAVMGLREIGTGGPSYYQVKTIQRLGDSDADQRTDWNRDAPLFPPLDPPQPAFNTRAQSLGRPNVGQD